MLAYIILFWILQELAAPTWCWVCFWAGCSIKIISAVAKATYEVGKEDHY